MRKLHSPSPAVILLAAMACTQASGMPRTPAMTLEMSGPRPFHATMNIAECWASGDTSERTGLIRAVGPSGDRVEFRITGIRKGTYAAASEHAPSVGPLAVVVGGARYTATGNSDVTIYDDAAKSGSLAHTAFLDGSNRPVTLAVHATWRCE